MLFHHMILIPNNVSSITAPQDAHTRVSAAGLSWFEHYRVQCYMYVKAHCYLAGLRDQSFVLPEVKSLRVQSSWLFNKALSSREEPDISLSIVNSKACFFTHALCVYDISLKRGSVLNTHSNDFIRRYIEHVTSCMRKNRFRSRCEG